jgi:hypothetical protein
MKPRSKSVWIHARRRGALVLRASRQARASFGPAVK